jgi:hypothetical protein
MAAALRPATVGLSPELLSTLAAEARACAPCPVVPHMQACSELGWLPFESLMPPRCSLTPHVSSNQHFAALDF